MWHPGDLFPITLAVRAIDMKIPLEEVANEMEQPGMFITRDIFEMPDTPGIVEATKAAFNRLKDSTKFDVEKSQAISYYWNAQQLRRVAPGGTLANPSRAPLNAVQIAEVMRQLRRHPDFHEQVLRMVSRDGAMIDNICGVVTVTKLP
jgi:hypothetical protein